MQQRQVGEVRVQPLAQTLRLADIDHPAVLVAESVDARPDRDGAWSGAVRRRIRHAVEPNVSGCHRSARDPAADA
jgi:hypothetical protein